ncbi:MAG TPA: hypothetical protein PKN96_04790 [Flavobacterium sp.]|uniref:hypothetical protein n=1 Tax=Flavobacterium sp. TaxID=239 RepID=UPI002CB6CBA2|nr:hypothetical protein [Flavobacterium sp.]HNP32586.1 hypothetical protein [Flavobacterium sp.]
MKKIILLLFVVLGITTAFAQEDNRPENTGDDFSLEGALELFKNSNSLEDFEKSLNQENNKVNNLDLDGDGQTDYINVEDIKENDSHVIVMSTYLNETEKQDIALIAIEKTADGNAVLQIEGDEDLFPKNTIIEPNSEEKGAVQQLKAESNVTNVSNSTTVVNVWGWPSVRYLYAPGYVVWVSPYRWRAYPRWWRPWRPITHGAFISYGVRYHPYYRPVTFRRVASVRSVYYPRRRTSTLVVHNRRGTTVIHKNRRGGVRAVRVNRVRGVRR